MGQTNLRASLKKRYSQLKGQRADLALRVEAVRRDASKLDEMEVELFTGANFRAFRSRERG